MLFKAGKSVTDQQREMIYALTRQINAQQVMMAKLARALIDLIDAPDAGLVKSNTRQVLTEIAAAGGE